MFKSEAKLFLSASNNVNSAKTLINECKRLIVDFDLDGNSDCKNLKSNINNCDINVLVTKVENTKESLMKLDQGFASEYMTLLQEFLQTSTIDTSNMTDEEKMQYSIQMNAYARDYNQTLLYMLEKYEESGMLTDELKQQLEYQRQLVAQYDIQDKMDVLDPSTDEYINLFKQNAVYERNLINLNLSLSEEEKANYLKEYNVQYNQNLETLINARDARLKREADEKELAELYADKEENSNFWHPFVEREINEAILDKKIEMGIATDDEIEYKNAGWFDRACMNTGTFIVSTFTGVFDVLETIVDGTVMLAGGIGGGLFGADTKWASDFVSIDLSGELYKGYVSIKGMNSYSAYGDWHTVGNMVGNTIGYVGLSFLPGGAIVTGLAGGLSAMGSSSERALNNGATFYEAFGTGAISGAVGFASGWAVGKFNAFASAKTTSLLKVGRNVLIGGGISTLEPIVNSVAEYAIYANDMIDENGNKVYDNIWDYYVDGGGLTNTAMAFGIGGISTGISSIKGYSNYKIELENKKVAEIYASEEFAQKSQQFLTEWGDHAKYSGDLQTSLEQQYGLLKTQGYKKSYSEFLSEYVSGSFDTTTKMHVRALKKFYTSGGVSVMTDEALIGSLTDRWNVGSRGIGYSDVVDATTGEVVKKGGAWIVPMDEQIANKSIPSTTDLDAQTLERARKGITTVPETSEMWEIQYSGEFLKEKGISLNSGPSKIAGASAAAMPGSKTYDLTTEGIFFTEALCPRVTFDFDAATANQIVKMIDGGLTDAIDLSVYGYPGIKFVKVK